MELIVCIILLFLILYFVTRPKQSDPLWNKFFNFKERGELGEILLEDIIKKIGLVKEVNYSLKESLEDGRCPDMKLYLSSKLHVYIDAKFPLDNYKKWIDSGNSEYLSKFKKDVRTPVKDIANKGYSDECGFTIMFIPNDLLFNKILDLDSGFVGYCLENNVICCSPSGLYAIVTMLKTIAAYLNIDKEAEEQVALIQKMKMEWRKYTEEFAKLEKHINSVNSTFISVLGTRSRQLDKAFNQIC
jgi:DNA recombination protein RmuC